MNKKSFRDLYVWEASVEVAVRVIVLAEELAAKKRFALADQMQRAAISVPSNIAEGHGRLTARDWRHFLSQARGSMYELETHFEIARRAHLIEDGEDLRSEIQRITSGLTRLMATIKV